MTRDVSMYEKYNELNAMWILTKIKQWWHKIYNDLNK